MRADKYSNMFRDFLASKHITQRQVVDRWNEKHPEHIQSYQGLNNKIRNNTLRWSEVLEMLSLFGYTVKFVETDTQPQPGQVEGVPFHKTEDSPLTVKTAAHTITKGREYKKIYDDKIKE